MEPSWGKWITRDEPLIVVPTSGSGLHLCLLVSCECEDPLPYALATIELSACYDWLRSL